MTATQPATRDLAEIVAACDVVERELLFQAGRLQNNVRADTSDSDPEHLEDLREGYGRAARYVGILRRYQAGRLERRGAPAEAEDVGADGRAVAFVDA